MSFLLVIALLTLSEGILESHGCKWIIVESYIEKKDQECVAISSTVPHESVTISKQKFKNQQNENYTFLV